MVETLSFSGDISMRTVMDRSEKGQTGWIWSMDFPSRMESIDW